MTFDSRKILIIASVFTLFQILLAAGLPPLFMMFSSEFGAILCGIGLWLLYKEAKANGWNVFRMLAGVFFVLLAIRFLLTGYSYLA